jgi:hypothetical protein
MADLGFTYNVNDLPEDEFENKIFPAGTYDTICTDSEIVAKDDGSWSALKVSFQIQEGPYQGETYNELYTLKSSNAEAMRMGAVGLRKLMDAAGLSTMQNSDVLHGRSFTANVTHTKKDGKEYNNIKSFGTSSSTTGQSTASAQSAKPAAKKAPWAR